MQKCVYEARHPGGHQVITSWQAYGNPYDAKRIADLESKGYVVKAYREE